MSEAETEVPLELDDIQSGVLRPRPSPYAATYVLLRIDSAEGGRRLMRRLADVVTPAAEGISRAGDAWVSVALTFEGLKALDLPQATLDSFAWEFQQGSAARGRALGDTGESAPENWEPPLGSSDVHVVVIALAPDAASLERAFLRAQEAFRSLEGTTAIWRQDCYAPAHEREHFGYRDNIGYPAIEGSGLSGSNPLERPLKAGEFVLGYRDEMGGFPPAPEPEVLGRNGTYVVFRKLHQRVAEYRQFLAANGTTPEDRELVAAKMMGRWRSGAPLAKCPFHDDPGMGADHARNNDFSYSGDPTGYDTPPGSHIRRSNPRDAKIAGVVRLHRMLRRGTAYGPPLADGVLEDDGVDRGLMFAFVGSHLKRQFEFVQSEWINDGVFAGLEHTRDPVSGSLEGKGSFSYPRRPVPKRLQGLSRFVITRGGEYCFMPGLRGLRWLADPT